MSVCQGLLDHLKSREVARHAKPTRCSLQTPASASPKVETRDFLDCRSINYLCLQHIIYSLGCCVNSDTMPSSGNRKQLKFGHRRHIAKPRTSLGSMEAEKRQSSLTQLDFVSTPHSSSEVIRIPDTDDEDRDFIVEQPRKKRRVSSKNSADDDWTPRANKRSSTGCRSFKIKQENGREKGQQTMTQMEFVPSTHRQHIVDDIEDDQDQAIDGSDEEVEQHTRSSRRGGRKRTIPWIDRAQDVVEDMPAKKHTPSPTKESARRSSRKIVESLPDLAIHSIAAHDFTTPKKALRHLEIPSSQSPPSIKLSSKRSQKSGPIYTDQTSPSKRANTPRRSPLKEKNPNIAPQRWQPETQESQNPTMKMLQQVRMRTKLGKAPLHEEAPMPPPKTPHSRVLVEATQNEHQRAEVRPPPRKLRRVATVQDSQAEDDSLTIQAAPPKLSRISTIQDSQPEDLVLSSQLYRSMSSREDIKDLESQAYNDEYDYNEYDDPGPHTFDPVSAALDRDAARYAWTQTQAPVGVTQRTKTQVADSEAESDDDDDLDRGIVPDSDSEDEIILLPNSTKEPSQELCSEDFLAGQKQDQEYGKAKSPAHNHPANPEKNSSRGPSTSPPSSPPPLRPSQVSTIMPTQASPQQNHQQNNSNPNPKPHSNPNNHPSSPPPSPPAAAARRFHPAPATQALTISSSPLPLPPWSSSGEETGPAGLDVQPLKQERGARDDLDTLVDFSLPPPPPLGLSSSPWR